MSALLPGIQGKRSLGQYLLKELGTGLGQASFLQKVFAQGLQVKLVAGVVVKAIACLPCHLGIELESLYETTQGHELGATRRAHVLLCLRLLVMLDVEGDDLGQGLELRLAAILLLLPRRGDLLLDSRGSISAEGLLYAVPVDDISRPVRDDKLPLLQEGSRPLDPIGLQVVDMSVGCGNDSLDDVDLLVELTKGCVSLFPQGSVEPASPWDNDFPLLPIKRRGIDKHARLDSRAARSADGDLKHDLLLPVFSLLS